LAEWATRCNPAPAERRGADHGGGGPLDVMLEDVFYHPERYCTILDCVSCACADVWVCVWGCGRALVCASAGLTLCRNALTPADSTL
jgi:hypothetical protein